MAMSIGSSNESDPLTEMNTTPLIDVMLVLLIMLIITLPVMTHIIKLDLPQQPGLHKQEVVNVEVEFDGTVLWNGNVVSDLEQLERYLRIEAAKDTQPELHVRSDKRAAYDTVAHVLASAQRSGMKKIGIVGNE